MDALDGVRAARLACVTPSHQFPAGGVLPLARRLALLAWAQRARRLRARGRLRRRVPLTRAGRSSACRRSTSTAACSTPAPPRSCSSRRCASAGWSRRPRSAPHFEDAKALADTGTATLEQLALADFIARGPPRAPRAPHARARSPRGARALIEALRARARRARAGARRRAPACTCCCASTELRGARRARAARGLPRARRRRLPGRALLRAPAARAPSCCSATARSASDAIREGVRRLRRALDALSGGKASS